jgi:hypothetical protein
MKAGLFNITNKLVAHYVLLFIAATKIRIARELTRLDEK